MLIVFFIGVGIGWYFFPQPESGKQYFEKLRSFLDGKSLNGE